ncbi:MAG: GNAT family N-acetyltransferase [Promethearchaeota archaeon]
MATENVDFRYYSKDDKKHVTKLMQELCQTFHVEFDKNRWEESLERKIKKSATSEMIVADINGIAIGMLVASIRKTNNEYTGYITNLIVAPEYRNKGVGEKLIKKAIDFFRERHVTSVKVNLRANSESAQRLFAKLGFMEYVIQYRKML